MDRWQQIEDLCQSALEREPAQRNAFLQEACGGDEALRREVESLLAYNTDGQRILDRPALQVVAEKLAEEPPTLIGKSLGPYQVVGVLGAGGMGEVYRARDGRLNREVAIKVLPRHLSERADLQQRFEQEARAVSALNHPNIITIHEIGRVDSVHYMVMELVEGKTLREILSSGALVTKRVLQLTTQVADGLAKAHAAGIVHRDLKPENLMITKEGLVKILDFGLAKQQVIGGTGPETVTLRKSTEPGILLGTVGYMSPEQARGEAIDYRSDQFSLGVILYEMLTGKRAFARESAAQTLAAIIGEQPTAIADLSPSTPTQLRWIVERCLAKDPEERYTSTRDLAREFQVLRDRLSEVERSGVSASADAPSQVQGRRLRLMGAVASAVLLAAFSFVAFRAGKNVGVKQVAPSSTPNFHRLTFQEGTISGARLEADGQSIVYGAAWRGKPLDVYTTRPESPESRSLGLQNSGIFSISSSGEMAIALGCALNWSECIGTLARVPLGGGKPRELLQNVIGADWAPDGKTLVVAWFKGQQCRLEYPQGTPLYETSGWIQCPRISPKGDLIAFVDHPIIKDLSGSVRVMDLTGKQRIFSTGWKGLYGLAWSPDGNEIWFSATKVGKGERLDIHAVTLLGQERLVYSAPTFSTVKDISRDGLRVLMARGNVRGAIVGVTPGSSKERDLGWFDYSSAADLSADGKALLFCEWGEAARGTHVSYLRKTDGSDPVRLGEGKPLALSPNGKWALVVQQTQPPQLTLLPTGTGEQKSLSRGAISEYISAGWFPDGRRIFFAGAEAGHGPRTYVQEIDGGQPRAVTDEGFVGYLLSPDGKQIVAGDRYGEFHLCPVDGGEPRDIDGYLEGDRLIQWSVDGRSLFLRGEGDLILKIYKLDLETGRREPWRDLTPPDLTGVFDIGSSAGEVRVTPDGKYYVYTSWTMFGELYMVEGLK
jgi:serine/threonine protein kinase/Tol biopolymer transport system component